MERIETSSDTQKQKMKEARRYFSAQAARNKNRGSSREAEAVLKALGDRGSCPGCKFFEISIGKKGVALNCTNIRTHNIVGMHMDSELGQKVECKDFSPIEA